MKIVLISGPSGSGKTTLARKKVATNWHHFGEETTHLEADMWHEIHGEYKWSKEEQGNAHNWCRLSFEYAVRDQHQNIIVSNTFTTFDELRPYFLIAIKYNQPIELNRTTTWADIPEECFKRNVHKVPLEVIKAQIARMHTLISKVYSVDELKELCQNYQKSS